MFEKKLNLTRRHSAYEEPLNCIYEEHELV